MSFDHYIQSGGKRLRCGYTTGTCAALAAKGAAELLLTGRAPEAVSLRTPKGWVVEVPLEGPRLENGTASAWVTKDGGDDVDATLQDIKADIEAQYAEWKTTQTAE